MERHFLLNFPNEILCQILDYARSTMQLWACGSVEFQSKMAQCVSFMELHLQDEGIPQLPSFISNLTALRDFRVSRDYGDMHLPIRLAKVLRTLNSALESLTLDFSLSESLFRPVPAAVTSFAGVGRGGQGLGRGGRGIRAMDDMDAMFERRGNGRNGRLANDEQVASESRKGRKEIEEERELAEFVPMDLAVSFPNLKKLVLCDSFGWRFESPLSLPKSLVHFHTFVPCTDRDMNILIQSLPPHLETLKSIGGSCDLSISQLSQLPSSLTDLNLFLSSEPILDLQFYQALPRGLTSIGMMINDCDIEMALALPPRLTSISIMNSYTLEAIKALPRCLISFRAIDINLDTQLPFLDHNLLQALPLGLRILGCGIDESLLQKDSFPPQLTSLSSYSKAPISANFSSFLPPSLRELSTFPVQLPTESSFYANLPPSLTYLAGQQDYSDPIGFSLPPRLEYFALGSDLPMARPTSTEPDADDYKPQAQHTTVKARKHGSSPSSTSEDAPFIKPPFPFHALPQFLLTFVYTERAIPMSALQYLPLLYRLKLAKIARDPKFDPNDPVLIDKASERRLFGQTWRNRELLASQPLNEVSYQLLLPRSLKDFAVVDIADLPPVPEATWCQLFPDLSKLRLGLKILLNK